jgi:hypothetical protein
MAIVPSKPSPGAFRARPIPGSSLTLWAIACGIAVIAIYLSTNGADLRIGAYRTGIVSLLLFVLAAAVAVRGRMVTALPHRFAHIFSRHRSNQNLPARNPSKRPNTSSSIKPKTWRRIHIALALAAMLPLWWHCDLERASSADLILKFTAILLLAIGFLGVTVTDLTRWRVLSPRFSPSLSASLIAGFFAMHRALAILIFALITIHLFVVLYFGGV